MIPSKTPATPNRSDLLHPLSVIMILLVLATVFGVCFLMNPPQRPHAPDGAYPWAEGSWLKGLTDALALGYAVPGPLGVEIKGLIFGVASGMALLIVGLGRWLSGRPQRSDADSDQSIVMETRLEAGKRHVDHLKSALVLFITFVAFSFASISWSPEPEMAFGGSVLLASYLAWILALRYGLNAYACEILSRGLVIILSLVAGLGIWYYYHRNQSMRVGYPIGNPLFFAACILPAIILSIAMLLRDLTSILGVPISSMCDETRFGLSRVRILISLLVFGACLFLLLWGFVLADSRGSVLGLFAAFAGLGFFTVRGVNRKLMVVLLAGMLAGLFLWPRLSDRSETIRTRLYAWSYAHQLVSESPVIGIGQGGYTIRADSLAVQDVEDDPRALKDRIAHAHNEWLETAVDLGSVGLVLILTTFALTMSAGVRCLRRALPQQTKWLLAGLLSGLFGMLVEECTDVGLRVVGLPTVFYTVMGLAWCVIAGTRHGGDTTETGRCSGWCASLASIVGLLVCIFSIWDFQASRASYEHIQKLQQEDWQAAVADVKLASHHRLNPTRRLSAWIDEIRCHMHIAMRYSELFQEKRREMQEVIPEELERLAGIAQDYQTVSRMHVFAALERIQRVLKISPHLLKANALHGHTWMILEQCLDGSETPQAVQQIHENIRMAFGQELLRQPHSVDITLKAIALNPGMSFLEAVELMCRPMRFHEVGSQFFTVLSRYMALESFSKSHQDLLQSLIPVEAEEPSRGAVTYRGEKLRILAWIAFIQQDYVQAREYAQHALRWADAQKDLFPLSPAITCRELAYYTFLADPSTPEKSIDLSQRGLSFVPLSHESTPTRESIKQRLIQYHLAAGDEEMAKALLPEVELLKPEIAVLDLLPYYLELCGALFQLPVDHRPEYFRSLLLRADELAEAEWVPPEMRTAPALMLSRFHYEIDELDRCIEYWKKALNRGANVEGIRNWAIRANQEHPGDEAIQNFLSELPQ